MDIEMTMLTFRDITSPRDRDQFFGILEAWPLFWPDAIRDELGRTIPFSADMDQREAIWSRGDRLILVRGEHEEVRFAINVASKEMRAVTGSFLYATLASEIFRDPKKLLNLTDLGNRLYFLFEPCYGFLTMPGFPALFGTALPMKGLPGWGWATWLGPEYRELIRLSPKHGISVTNLRDGGQLYLLPIPFDVMQFDLACAEAYKYVLESLDPQLFQTHPPVVDAKTRDDHQREIIGSYMVHEVARRKAGLVKVPKFRFRDIPGA